MCCWIGSGFCSGKGPWRVVDGELIKAAGGKGVWRQLPCLSDSGQGVNRQQDRIGSVRDWMASLAKRLERVRVCCGDWTRVCGGKSGNAIDLFFAAGKQCAVFLDPPYSAEAGRDESLYTHEDLSIAHAVREWAIRHGDDSRLRIALCGYDGEHEMPANWTAHSWKAHGGMAVLGKGDTRGKANAHREVIWFSPHCNTI